MNPFEKLLGNFLHNKAADTVVGLDIGSSFIKAIQLRKKNGKILLDTYGEIALGPLAGLEVGQATQLPVDKIVEATLDLFREANITGKDIVIGLPLTSTLLSVIEMPDLGEAKLKEMIPIEARKYIPTAASEVSLNWWIIPKLVGGYVDPDEEEKKKSMGPRVDVLLAAVHNDVIARYKQIAEKLGATSAAFEIEIFSTIRSVIGRESALSMVFDMGALNTKITMVSDGIVRSSHLINSGSQDITSGIARSKGISMLEAEEIKRDYGILGAPNDPSISEVVRFSVDRIALEAGRIFMNYQNNKHVTIGKVFLTGGGVLLKGFPDLAKATFAGAEVMMVDPFARVEAQAVLGELLKDSGPEFAVAIGLALRKF